MSDSISDTKRARIFYARVDEFARKEEKYKFLDDAGSVSGVEWQELQPDAKQTWLTEGMHAEFATFLPIVDKTSRDTNSPQVFVTYSPGVNTARDTVAYNFGKAELLRRIEQFCDAYNAEVQRYRMKGRPADLDSFLKYDQIKWSRNLKRDLRVGNLLEINLHNCREGAYRPFAKRSLYFADIVVDELGKFPRFFPTINSEKENFVICVNAVGSSKPFHCVVTNNIADFHFTGDSSCFPLYTYDEDGTNRRDNITDWALAQFRTEYASESISKLDIFHYVYALLHHPTYRTTYAANLKRELPRIPFVDTLADFQSFVRAGARLADLHVNYEAQTPYKLDHIENPDADLDWRVERMRLAKNKEWIIYNDFLTLGGIPPEAFEYRLGNRSALEWIVDQYQVSTDKRSRLTNDPNRADEPDYIVKLIGKVTTVSVETVRVVRSLPALSVAAESAAVNSSHNEAE